MTWDIYAEVAAERERAHAKHGQTSMEAQPWYADLRQHILVEEVGEVAKEFNEARHQGDAHPDPKRLRKELIQTAAMAVAWADAIDAQTRDLLEGEGNYLALAEALTERDAMEPCAEFGQHPRGGHERAVKQAVDFRGRTADCLPFCQGGLHEVGCPSLGPLREALTERDAEHEGGEGA